jgi:hypothetical protein
MTESASTLRAGEERQGPEMDGKPVATAEQMRILRLMLTGDMIWEVAGKRYRSVYNERLGRHQRIRPVLVEELEQQDLIRRLDNRNPCRLDGWELTEQGRALAVQRRARRKSG